MDQDHNFTTPLHIVGYSLLLCVMLFVLMAIVLNIRNRILTKNKIFKLFYFKASFDLFLCYFKKICSVFDA